MAKKEAKPGLTIKRTTGSADTAIKKVMEKLNKDFGIIDGEPVVTTGRNTPQIVDAIPTGSLLIDATVYYGGAPCGRFTEIFGPEYSGKTTLLYLILINAQQKFPDKFVGIIDVEYDFKEDLFEEYGGDLDRITIVRVYSAEEQMTALEELLSTGYYSAFGVGSVAAMETKAELDGEYGDAVMGKHAKLMSQSCGKLLPLAALYNTAIIWINQTRDTLSGYGNPETTPGGKALKFYSSLRLRCSKPSGGTEEGQILKTKIVKTKGGPGSGKEVEPYLTYGVGFDPIDEVIDVAIDLNLVKKLTSQSKEWTADDGTKFTWTSRQNPAEIMGEYFEQLKTTVINSVRKTKVTTEIEDLYVDEEEGDE